MKIQELKRGDVITRNEPVEYKHNEIRDGSYLGERLVLLGFDNKSKTIHLDTPLFDDLLVLSWARDGWDSGWSMWPKIDRIKDGSTGFSGFLLKLKNWIKERR